MTCVGTSPQKKGWIENAIIDIKKESGNIHWYQMQEVEWDACQVTYTGLADKCAYIWPLTICRYLATFR